MNFIYIIFSVMIILRSNNKRICSLISIFIVGYFFGDFFLFIDFILLLFFYVRAHVCAAR